MYINDIYVTILLHIVTVLDYLDTKKNISSIFQGIYWNVFCVGVKNEEEMRIENIRRRREGKKD